MTSIKLIAVAGNYFSKGMDRSIIGRTISGEYTLTPAECAEFARAIRDHRRADPLFVSPFIFARIFLEPVKRVIFDASARINLVRMVHGDVDVKWYRPFRMERSVRYTLSVKDIPVTTAGEILVFSGRIYEGEHLVVEVTSGFPVRAKKRAGRHQKADPPEERTLLRTLDFVTEKRQSHDYAYASGDMNPIHRSGFFARVAGFGRPIMHGMCVMGMCERVMVNNLTDNEYFLPRAMSGRFSSPVFPGEKLFIHVFEPLVAGDGKVYEFEVVNERGKKVIRNGTLTV